MQQLVRPKLTTQTFADRLRELSDSRGSYSQISRDLGINRQQFARYLNGTSRPRDALVRKMAEYFDVEPGAFFQQQPLVPEFADGGTPANSTSFALLTCLAPIAAEPVTEAELPSGMYMHYRQSFTRPGTIVCQLSRVFRDDTGVTYSKRRYSILMCRDLPGVNVWHHAIGVFAKKHGTFMLMENNSVAGDFVFSSIKSVSMYTLADRLMTGLVMTHGRASGVGAVAGRCVLERIPADEFKLDWARMQGFRQVEDLPDYVQGFFADADTAPDGVLAVR